MQYSACHNATRCRLLYALVCLVTLLVSELPAQLRFAGPSNYPADETSSTSSPGGAYTVSQTQFRPLNPADSLPLAPQVPGAGDELDLNADLPPAPPVQATSESIPTPDGLPAPMGSSQPPQIWSAPSGDAGSIIPEYGDVLSHGMANEEPLLYSTNSWFRTGRWFSNQDIVVMIRTENPDIVVSSQNRAVEVFDSDTNSFEVSETAMPHSVMLTTKTVDPTYVPGTRLTLGRFLGQDIANRDHAIEFTFLGLFSYSDTAVQQVAADQIREGTNGNILIDFLQTPLSPGAIYRTDGEVGIVSGPTTFGFSNARRHEILYDSDMNSFELNFRIMGRPNRDMMTLQPNGTWVRYGNSSSIKSMLIGTRFISINELFRFQSQTFNSEVNGTHEVKTGNNMFGLQLGGEHVENYTTWSWGARFKAGGLYNFADARRKIHVTAFNDSELDFDDSTDQNLAAVLEGGLFATYQLRTNLSARIAYDAMYITGIATAPQNLGLDPAFPKFEVSGDAIFHGLSCGLEMLW